MKIVLAFDSFKGCLSATEIIEVATLAITKIIPLAEILSFTLADGGEGTLDTLVTGASGQLISHTFTNLENKQLTSQIGIINDTCIIECAQTVGLPQSNKQQIEFKTTKGMGEQIKYALDLGYHKFAIGLGGSGTNDVGLGMLAELGYRFLDQHHQLIEPILANMKNIADLDDSTLDRRLKDCEFTILSDVKNPLYGSNGATYIYGAQKGVLATQLVDIDNSIANFSNLATQYFGFDKSQELGAGAAGGLGYAFLQFLNAKLVSGIDYVLDKLNVAEAIQKAEIVFTGEGRSDSQTANGKVALGVAKLAKQYHKPVLLISGALSEDAYQLHNYGIDYLSSIQDYPAELSIVMQATVAKKLLAHKIEETMRLLLIGKNLNI